MIHQLVQSSLHPHLHMDTSSSGKGLSLSGFSIPSNNTSSAPELSSLDSSDEEGDAVLLLISNETARVFPSNNSLLVGSLPVSCLVQPQLFWTTWSRIYSCWHHWWYVMLWLHFGQIGMFGSCQQCNCG